MRHRASIAQDRGDLPLPPAGESVRCSYCGSSIHVRDLIDGDA